MIVTPPHPIGDSPVWWRWRNAWWAQNGVSIVRSTYIPDELDLAPGGERVVWRHPVFAADEGRNHTGKHTDMDSYRAELDTAVKRATRVLPPVDAPVNDALVERYRKIARLRDGTTFEGERTSAQERLDALCKANPGLPEAVARKRPMGTARYFMVEWPPADEHGSPIRVQAAYYHAWPGAKWRTSTDPRMPLLVSMHGRPMALVMPVYSPPSAHHHRSMDEFLGRGR